MAEPAYRRLVAAGGETFHLDYAKSFQERFATAAVRFAGTGKYI